MPTFDNSPRVAVLCAAPRSIYRQIDGVDIYNRRRDAWTFAGDMPVVAHPPCRVWSAKTKHQAKPDPGERELGLFCCEQLRQCGGVLEQPAFSELFAAAGFPKPGTKSTGDVWTLEIWQAWFGYPMKKTTWLAFAGIPREVVEIPLILHQRGGDERTEQVMSREQRSATPLPFAKWLVAAARLSAKEKP